MKTLQHGQKEEGRRTRIGKEIFLKANPIHQLKL